MHIIKQSKSVPGFVEDELTATGLWPPSLHQFNLKTWNKSPKTPQCNHWSEQNWGYMYKPIKVKIWGDNVKAVKQTLSYGKNNKANPYCQGYRMNFNTCELIECTDWEKPKAHSYLIKSKTDAMKSFHQL